MTELFTAVNHIDHVQHDRYYISNKGRLFDTKFNRYINPYTHKRDDLETFKLSKMERSKGKFLKTEKTVSRLVAEMFVDNYGLPTEQMSIEHIDGNNKNHCADNLRWYIGGRSQNELRIYAKDYETFKEIIFENRDQSSLKIVDELAKMDIHVLWISVETYRTNSKCTARFKTFNVPEKRQIVTYRDSTKRKHRFPIKAITIDGHVTVYKTKKYASEQLDISRASINTSINKNKFIKNKKHGLIKFELL